MTDPQDRHSDARDEADDALDRALRERPVDEESDLDFDDDLGDPPADPQSGSHQQDRAADEGEDYVLYSEVRPHLEALVQLQNERTKMIDILLYARDRVSSPAVASRMDDNLAQLGIRIIEPRVGDRFDPTQHEASATVATDDAGLHATIAEIELAGYSDGEQIVRHPVVTVYTTERA